MSTLELSDFVRGENSGIRLCANMLRTRAAEIQRVEIKSPKRHEKLKLLLACAAEMEALADANAEP